MVEYRLCLCPFPDAVFGYTEIYQRIDFLLLVTPVCVPLFFISAVPYVVDHITPLLTHELFQLSTRIQFVLTVAPAFELIWHPILFI
jgi:hypothetical protein